MSEAIQITVTAKRVDKKYLLKEIVGTGEYGDIEYELLSTIPNRSLLVEFNNKKYLVSSADIIKAVIDVDEAEKNDG